MMKASNSCEGEHEETHLYCQLCIASTEFDTRGRLLSLLGISIIGMMTYVIFSLHSFLIWISVASFPIRLCQAFKLTDPSVAFCVKVNNILIFTSLEKTCYFVKP